MKYSKDQICRMSWQEWNKVMAKELTAAGFTERAYINGRWVDNMPIQADYEPKFFISSAITDVERLNCLKRLGLIDNGRCPMCGGRIEEGHGGRYTDRFNREYTYQICHKCVASHGGRRPATTPQGGCLLSIFALAIIISVLIF